MTSLQRKWILALLLLGLAVWCGLSWAQNDLISDGTIPMSPREKAWLAEHRGLRLGMWLGAPPVMFRGEQGEMQGMVPSYLNFVIKKLGLNPKRVRASSFAALWELGKAREVDMVAAVTGEPERRADMLLSEPYLFLPIVIVTRSDFPFISGLGDLGGRVVAMSAEHVPHLRIPHEYEDIIPMPVSGPEQGLQAVSNGVADAYVAAQATTAYLSREKKITNIRIAAVTEYSYKLSIGVRKDWPILLELVNRALASITEDEKREIRDYWTVLRYGNWMDRPQMWRIIASISVGALVLILMIFFWNRRLAREAGRRKQAEERFRQAHEATEHIIESADVVIVGLDFTGHVRLLNRAGERVTGYSREELMDKDWFDLVVPRERYLFAWDKFNRMAREGTSEGGDTLEHPVVTKSGEARQVLWRYSTADSDKDTMSMIAFGTDITSRLEAEEELRLTQFAMDNAAVGMFRVHPFGEVKYANRTTATQLGYTRTELRRMSILEIVPNYTRENWPGFWDKLKEKQMLTFERDILRKDGSTFPAEITAYYLLFKGTELAIGFFVDISERRRVDRLREDVERMVRHDLRSPTLAVQTLFKLFGEAENLTDDQHELLESVMESSRRMINIIDMSRAIYRMEAGTYEVVPSPVDLIALSGQVMTDLRPLLRSKHVTVSLSVEHAQASMDHVFRVESEELLCYALLANLIKNAVEASPDKGVVTVDFSAAGITQISVHNQGVIPESIRDSFFEKYVTSGKTQGTGLGTYTARLITYTLGGEISFTTSEKDGTLLTVSLPQTRESHS